MNEHSQHRAGTVTGCKDCSLVAYEPSWYASLLTFSQVTKNVITLETDARVAIA